MRLIDADALAVIDGKVLFMGRNAGKMRAMTIDLVKQLVATAPTIDTVEVRHGKWRFRKNWDFFVCSECSCENTNYSHYCPNCGAKMDGKGEGE